MTWPRVLLLCAIVGIAAYLGAAIPVPDSVEGPYRPREVCVCREKKQ